MLGKFLSETIKVVTMPIDVGESLLDVLIGGDGTKKSKQFSDCNIVSAIRDGICRGLEDCDK